jgi:hypothetical protein
MAKKGISLIVLVGLPHGVNAMNELVIYAEKKDMKFLKR